MSTDLGKSPAAKVMDGAIDLAMEGRSPYSKKAAFIDADAPSAGHAIERAADQGLSVVLVSADGSTRILRPDLAAHQTRREAANAVRLLPRLLVRLGPEDPYSRSWDDLRHYGPVRTERFLLDLYYVCVVTKD